MDTRTTPPPEVERSDTQADTAAPFRIDEAGARWTGEPFEGSPADAVYCPVLEAGNGTR